MSPDLAAMSPGLPPSTSRRGEPAAETWLLAGSLAAAALFLLTLPYLPFQDVPNHALLLTYDRVLGAEGNAWLQRPPFVSFGYTAYIWISRLLAPMFSVDAVLRILAVVAVVGLPLATARLATALGAPGALAGLLVLPFALGWPLRMGLLSFVLGVPLALLCAASAVLLLRRPTAGRALLLALQGAAAYLTHAFAFGLALVLVGLAAATAEKRARRPAAGSLILALVPALILVAWDAWHGSWRPTDAASPVSAPGQPIRLRPPGEALSHVACRTYGIPRASTLPPYLPHLVLLAVALGALAVRRRGPDDPAFDPAVLRFLLAGGSILTLGTVLMPDSVGRAYLLGSRPAMAGMCLVGIVAALSLRQSGLRGARPLAAALAILACTASVAGIARDAREVREVVGTRPPRSVQGNVLVARAAECRRHMSYRWGGWDPLRLVWAYALSAAASTPYLFAEHRYDMVWHRPGANRPHPPAGRALSDERNLDPVACEQRNRERVLIGLGTPGYDGVVVLGPPDAGRRAIEASGVPDPIRLAPGMWLVSAPAAPARDRAAAPRRSGR